MIIVNGFLPAFAVSCRLMGFLVSFDLLLNVFFGSLI
jgi:hypothetical protein